MRRANVISIGSLARPIGEVTGIGTTVPAAAKVIEVAEQVLAASGPVGVVDANDAVIGTVTPEAVIAMLLERPTGASAG